MASSSFNQIGNLWKLKRNYFHYYYQRVVLNGQTTTWELLNSRVPQGSILGPLMILIHMNDLADVFDKDTSQDELSEDFKISNWAIQWKMQFNPDPKKEGQKVLLSKNTKNTRPFL